MTDCDITLITNGPHSEVMWDVSAREETLSRLGAGYTRAYTGKGVTRVEAVMDANSKMRASLKDKGLAANLSQRSLDNLAATVNNPSLNETSGVNGLYMWAALLITGDQPDTLPPRVSANGEL